MCHAITYFPSVARKESGGTWKIAQRVRRCTILAMPDRCVYPRVAMDWLYHIPLLLLMSVAINTERELVGPKV